MTSVTVERPSENRFELVAWARWIALASAASVLVLMWIGWWFTAKPVRVTVDGLSESISTHRVTVADLLLDLGIQAGPRDRVAPPSHSLVTRGMALTIDRAQPIRILADGRDLLVSSWGLTPRAVLADAEIALDTYDQVLVDGVAVAAGSALPAQPAELAQRMRAAPTFDRGFAWDAGAETARRTEPVQLRIYRAVPIVVHEGGLPYTIDTTAQTIGEALRQAEVVLYLGDRVHPSLGSRVSAGTHVYIERSIAVALRVDGRQIKTRTQAELVGEALSDLGVAVTGMDRVQPPLDAPLYDNVKIAITRVTEDVEIEEEIASYDTVFVADPNLPIDTQAMLDPGANGITRTRYRVRYENGTEVKRVREDTWVAQDPAERRIAYGQLIEPKTATLDGQFITYWRKVKMYATSYNPAAVGNNTTATGDVVTKGVVAVDPRIIPMRSQLFVPDYGQGTALDTGGGIVSRRIDLGYDDRNFVSLSKWVDVYLLWPPPASFQITWVLPNYPPLPE